MNNPEEILQKFELHRKLSTQKRIDGMSISAYKFLRFHLERFLEHCSAPNRSELVSYVAFRSLSPHTKSTIAWGLGRFFYFAGYITKDDYSILTRSFRAPQKNWSTTDLNTDTICKCLDIALSENNRFNATRNASIIALLSTTGARIHQVTTLRLTDYKYIASELIFNFIRQKHNQLQLIDNYDIKHIPSHKTVGNYVLADLLNEYLDIRLNFKHKDVSGNLFVNYYGMAIADSSIQKLMKQLSGKLGKKFTPHSFRHYVGTKVANEQGIEKAAVLLGHSDIRVTQRYFNPSCVSTADIISKL